MNCPVCGSKMVDKQICRYCGVTREQVLTASNIKAKQAYKSGNKESVCYTTDMPSDVNKKKLVLLTVFLGFAGVGNFVVGKTTKGLFCAISTGLGLIFSLLSYLSSKFSWGIDGVFNLFMNITAIFITVALLFWISDIVSLIFKHYKVPVVLGEDNVKMNVKSIKRSK